MTVSDSRDLRNVMDETKDCHEFDASMIIDWITWSFRGYSFISPIPIDECLIWYIFLEKIYPEISQNNCLGMLKFKISLFENVVIGWNNNSLKWFEQIRTKWRFDKSKIDQLMKMIETQTHSHFAFCSPDDIIENDIHWIWQNVWFVLFWFVLFSLGFLSPLSTIQSC
jgi:hypothetical protein